MRLEWQKPTDEVVRKGKYQFIYDAIPNITEEKAIVLVCENDENKNTIRICIGNYLRKKGIRKRYVIMVRENKVYVQLKNEKPET